MTSRPSWIRGLIALGLTDAADATADPQAVGMIGADPAAGGHLPATGPSPLDGDTAARVRDAVRNLNHEVIDAVSGLIRIPSISPNCPGQDSAAVTGGETRCAETLTYALLAAEWCGVAS